MTKTLITDLIDMANKAQDRGYTELEAHFLRQALILGVQDNIDTLENLATITENNCHG